jgi:hypothetical protein
MPLRTIDPVIANRRYPASTTPSINPIRGYFWSEIDSNGDLVQDWFWNGTYWLSTFPYFHPISASSVASATFVPSSFNFANNYNLFLERCRIIGRIEGAVSPGGATDSATNYYDFIPRLVVGGTSATIVNAPTISLQNRTYTQFSSIFLTSAVINTHIPVGATGVEPDATTTIARGFGFTINKTNTPPNITQFVATLNCRFARP